MYFQTELAETDAVLIQKQDETGYSLHVNKRGSVVLATKSLGETKILASRGIVNDGQWHHVMAEADRLAGTFAIYIDGERDSSGTGIDARVSLANSADLYVGGTPQGHHLSGAIDFLRIARGTLAEAQTTIDELYDWQFRGPFLDDFTGRPRAGDGGAAGALDRE